MLDQLTNSAQKRRLSSLHNPPPTELGKLPPQNVQAEEAVLGALMLEQQAIGVVYELLTPDSFYRSANQEVYTAIRELFERNDSIDMVTVIGRLRKSGRLEAAGGAHRVAQLTENISSTANLEYHATLVAEKYIKRRLITIGNELQRDAYEETVDVFSQLDNAEQAIFAIAEGSLRKQALRLSKLMSQTMEHIAELKLTSEGFSGIATGFEELDRITSGLQKSDLIVLAGRPGMGKTSLAMTIARNAAVMFKKPVAIFSLEMSSIQLTGRLMASEARIKASKLKTGTLTDNEVAQLHSKIGDLADAPIYIDDTAALDIFELRSKCRRLKADKGIELVVLDYLQLMSSPADRKGNVNREQEISNISRSLKAMAKELNIPVMALAQLSRQVEQRGGTKRPQLSDLRESGAIEQDADQVFFIYRPEVYGFDEVDDGVNTDGLAELIIGKNRHGETTSMYLGFDKEHTRFTNYGSEHSFSSFSSSSSSGGYGSSGNSDAMRTISRSSRINEEDENDDDPFGISPSINPDDEDTPF